MTFAIGGVWGTGSIGLAFLLRADPNVDRRFALGNSGAGGGRGRDSTPVPTTGSAITPGGIGGTTGVGVGVDGAIGGREMGGEPEISAAAPAGTVVDATGGDTVAGGGGRSGGTGSERGTLAG